MTVIRGAISVDSDSPSEITRDAVTLYEAVRKNNPQAEISALLASQTNDLISYNCCTALRSELAVGFALECFQEAYIRNQTERIIRFTVLCNNDFKPKHVYLKNASQLRPDLAINSSTS